jgi:small nuclear ribonucleoprotein (snRNP)-like protein
MNSFFKTLVDHEVTVELKNDIQIRGTLKSVDQYLNIKLDDIQVVEDLKYPHLVSQKLCDGRISPRQMDDQYANWICSHRSRMCSSEAA